MFCNVCNTCTELFSCVEVLSCGTWVHLSSIKDPELRRLTQALPHTQSWRVEWIVPPRNIFMLLEGVG